MEIDQLTVADCVRRAARIVDPDGSDDAVTALLEAYEDDDRAAPGLGAPLGEELRTTAAGLDPEGDDAQVRVAAAVAFLLSTKPEGGSDDGATLQLAVRLEWGDDPPEGVLNWVKVRG